MAALPFELIEVILKNLYTNPFSKPACLAACSLVCRGWRPIAQALFFSEVSIPDGPNRPPVQPGQDDLYPWFTENPNLQLYVRRLWIRSLQESRIGKLASSLPNLEQLVIFDPSKLDGNETIPSRLMDSLYENIHSNHLTSLCISDVVDFPVHTFYLCSSLRELKIRGTSFEGLRADTYTFEHEESLDYARSLDPDPSPRPRLQSLHLSISSPGSVGIFLWLLTPGCAFDLSELKTLHCLDRTDAIACFSRVVRLVDFVSSSLEDLMVDPPTWCGSELFKPTPDTILPAEKLVNLRTIQISILQQESDDYTDYIPWVVSFLSNLPSDHSLERVLIPCMLIDHHDDDYDFTIYDWGKLDAILASPKFRPLLRVGVAIYDYAALERSRNQLIKALPVLSEKGILKVTFSRSIGCMTDDEDWWSRFEEPTSL